MGSESLAVRRLARELSRLDRLVTSFATTPQLTSSSLPIGDGEVRVDAALVRGIEGADLAEQVEVRLDQARAELEAAQAILDDKLADAELGIEGANERLDDAEVLIDEAFTLAEQAKSNMPNRVDDPDFSFGDQNWQGTGGGFDGGLSIGTRFIDGALVPIAETVDRTGTTNGGAAWAAQNSTYELRLDGTIVAASLTVTFGGIVSQQQVTKTVTASNLREPIRLTWPTASGGPVRVRIQATTTGGATDLAVLTSVSVTDVTTITEVKATADAALVSANGKQNIYRDTGDPSGTAPENSVWFKVNGAGSVIAQFQYVDGAWVETPVASEVIANLDVGKLTAGSAVIDELVAQKIAAASGQFLSLDVGQLVASEAVIGEAVAQKIWADSTVTRLLTAEDIIAGSAIITGTITGDQIAANSITAQNLTLTPGNLVDDPGFTRPFGETWVSTSGTAPTIEENPDLPGMGLRFATEGVNYVEGASVFDVIPGEQYAVSARGTGLVILSLVWIDADGGRSFATATDEVFPTGDEIGEHSFKATAPGTAVYGQVFIYGSAEAGFPLWIGKIQVRPAIGASLIVDGAIDGKMITGGVIRTAATGTRVFFGPSTGGEHGMWGYDSAGRLRFTLNNRAASGAIIALSDANGVERTAISENLIRFYSDTNDIRTRLTDVGAQFYNNARVDFYGAVDRYGILERGGTTAGMTLWGGNGTSNTWASLTLEALSDGGVFNTSGIYTRESTNPANVRINSTGTLYRTSSVKSAKIDVTDAHTGGLLNVAYRSWIDKQEMIDAVLGRAADPSRRVVGAVAEEMEQVAPELCTYDSDGNLTGIAYERVGLALIPFLRDLTNRVETLEGAEQTAWPVSPTYDDTALLDEVTAYGLEDIEPAPATEPRPEVIDE